MSKPLQTDALPQKNDVLTPELIAHASKGQPFLGFISYRRGDGLPLARWLRDRISNFAAPVELREKIASFDNTVGGKGNRVFLDMSYQKPNVDFWNEHIAASLCRSKTMILLQTPSVFQRLDNGGANWCEREIETFLSYFNEPSRILIVMGPGAPIDRFPRPLEDISSRWDWVDLRFFSESRISRFRNASQYDAQLAKILAKLYDIEDGEIPYLNREFARARANARRNLAGAAGVAICALSALTVWALKERNRAEAAEQVALRERDTAVQQRNAALVSQSRYLAKEADDLVRRGMVRGAIALLREALPDRASGRDRPLVTDAIISAYNAIYSNRERGRLSMPDDARVATTNDAGTMVVIATPKSLVIDRRNGKTTEVPHNIDAPESISIAPNDDSATIVSQAGEVSVIDLVTGKILARHPGMGPKTQASFFMKGSRLLITDARQRTLQVVDVKTGHLLGAKSFANTNEKAIRSLIDRDSDAFFMIADETLFRLHPDSLIEQARFAIKEADEYALGLSNNKGTLFLAAARVILQGRIIELDAKTLQPRRSFGRLAWGARGMSTLEAAKQIAVHGVNGVDFFSTSDGEILAHVATPFQVAGGRYIGNNYLVFGSGGAIARITPELGTVTGAYQTGDGQIVQLMPLPDRSGFLSISSSPSITEWSFEARGVSQSYTIPLVINGIPLNMATPLETFAYDFNTNTVIGSYTGNSLYRWDLSAGTSKMLSDRTTGTAFNFVADLNNGSVVRATRNGSIEVLFDGANRTQLSAPSIKLTKQIGPGQAAALTDDGSPLLITASNDKAEMRPIANLGPCKEAGAITNGVLCWTRDERLTVMRISDQQILFDVAIPEPGLVSATLTEDASRMAIVDKSGAIQIWTRQGSAVSKVEEMLMEKSPRQPFGQQAGAATSTPFAISDMNFSMDASALAVAIYNGPLIVFDLQKGERQIIPRWSKTNFERVQLSPHARLVAAVIVGDYRSLHVYEIESGQRIATVSLNDQTRPRLFAMPNGDGFMTIDETGVIVIHPAFEESQAFIDYLMKKFPDGLTARQRREYFLE